jgi:hypothetical protein
MSPYVSSTSHLSPLSWPRLARLLASSFACCRLACAAAAHLRVAAAAGGAAAHPPLRRASRARRHASSDLRCYASTTCVGAATPSPSDPNSDGHDSRASLPVRLCAATTAARACACVRRWAGGSSLAPMCGRAAARPRPLRVRNQALLEDQDDTLSKFEDQADIPAQVRVPATNFPLIKI